MTRHSCAHGIDPHELAGIVRRCRDGDAAAFEHLVRMTQTLAYALAFRMLCDEEDARDAVQEAYVRVWTHLGSYDASVRFTTWLHTIVSRLCLDRLRERSRDRRRHVRLDGDAADVPDAAEDGPGHALERRDLARRISELTLGLPPMQRLVFTLRDLQDLDVRDVCAVTGLDPERVKANLYHARKAVRALLERLETVHEDAS